MSRLNVRTAVDPFEQIPDQMWVVRCDGGGVNCIQPPVTYGENGTGHDLVSGEQYVLSIGRGCLGTCSNTSYDYDGTGSSSATSSSSTCSVELDIPETEFTAP